MAVYNGTSSSDVFYGDNLFGGGGTQPTNDVMYGFGGNDVLIGLAGSDTLYGGDGDDSLRSGNVDGAIDRLFGGKGEDTYWVREFNDIVTEYANEGIRDIVELWYGFQGIYTLPANVENLLLRDGDGGIGNVLDNSITGSLATRAVFLDGREGNDNISGGNYADTLLGGLGNDSLTGRAGNDILNGGLGTDTLNGGDGSDRFVFDTNAVFNASTIEVDIIQGFTVGTDKIVLDKTTFTALRSGAGNGFNVVGDFATVTTDTAAATSSATIVYNSSARRLFYNQNGSLAGFGSGGQFALFGTSLSSPLSIADFIIQA
ncbi:calcium-binding protein [Leptolyngbya sp. NIES-2104]|uniref:calcium-binding protein n=1 Tax=Leptolyngbya sp. NIES-2104 TaxID=1552121 RepID=UPI0006EC5D0B|nr:calcium-binding protein [Leptolyngbya sp. NIES-2104]GAP95335.1 alkaline phosphatase [Leptolyngbya sp. NIES-2104]